MKVFAVNGSPAGDSGNTAAVLNPFLRGMEKAGAKINKYNTRGMKIKECMGCYKCWYSHGKCCIKDDMQKILPEMIEADIWVVATPLYTGGMTASLKMLIDRTFATSDHHIRLLPSGETGKIPQYKGKLVFISSCGLYELKYFDALLEEMKEISRIKGRKFVGALLRPHAGLLPKLAEPKSTADKMKTMLELITARLSPSVSRAAGDEILPINIKTLHYLMEEIVYPFSRTDSEAALDVVIAAEFAGLQLVNSGKISEELLRRVSQPLCSVEDYVKIADAVHREMFAKAMRK